MHKPLNTKKLRIFKNKATLFLTTLFYLIVLLAWNKNPNAVNINAEITKLNIADTSTIESNMANLSALVGTEKLFADYCIINMASIKNQIVAHDAKSVAIYFASISSPTTSQEFNLSNSRLIVKYLDANNKVLHNAKISSYPVFGNGNLCPNNCDMYFNAATPTRNLNAQLISIAQCNQYENNFLNYTKLNATNANKVFNFRQIVLSQELFSILENFASVKIFLGSNNNNLIAYALAINTAGMPDFNNMYEIPAENLCPNNCD